MTRLFSYRIPIDDGAAPNPYWGVCTLVICKPRIRAVAKVGDWIVGTGSKNSPVGDIEKCVVYAMKVTDVLSLADYDQWTLAKCPNKVPDLNHRDKKVHLGDSLYDYSRPGVPVQRPGVHNARNIKTDLGGKNALLSTHFYYFGDQPQLLPELLWPIIKDGRGHKSQHNTSYVADFLKWISEFELNKIVGSPQINLFKDATSWRKGCEARAECAEDDELSESCD